MAGNIFLDLSIILVVSVVIAGVMRLLKQPIIIGYIISGILLGPFFFNIISSTQDLATFSHIGVALLLFMVGLNLNPKVIKEVGKVSSITGVGQVLFTSLIGYFLAQLLGFSVTSSIYIAIALTFSSTIIIMKLLSDRNHLDTLYGRISMGFLIVQDLIAVAILLIISSLSNGTSLTALAIESLLKGIGGILLLAIITRYIITKSISFIAKSQEYLLLFSLGWCFAIASLFHYLNFSIEVGALLAGISLSFSPYSFEIGAKMKVLRDFFLIIFFIILGAQMVFSSVLENIIAIIIFSLFVLFGNPLIVMLLMKYLGYTKRTNFLAGLTVAQISEFSLIVVGLGYTVGHISRDVFSIVTAIALLTFAGSAYMIMYSDQIYQRIGKYLKIFERKGKKIDDHRYHNDKPYDLILFGYNRIGYDVLKSIKKTRKKVLIVDYDPKVIINLSKKGFHCRYGDANDIELLHGLKLEKAKMIVSTIPTVSTNSLLINKVREKNKETIIAVVAHQIDEAIQLYDQGATYVLMPHFLGGKYFSTMIEHSKFDIKEFLKEKSTHLRNIKHRKKMGHEHPLHERRR